MIAISTACKQALIGIEIGGQTIVKSLPSNCKHSENILFTMDKMLDEIGQDLSANQNFAVVVGPGSFTGIRIGVSLIKGLLAGENKRKVVPITTFDLMAYSYIKNFSPDSDFACIINGLSGYYFVCKYNKSGRMIGKEELVTSLPNCTIVGLEEEGLGEVNINPTAEELLNFAKEKLQKGDAVYAKEICPMYLRKSQAESNLEDKK